MIKLADCCSTTSDQCKTVVEFSCPKCGNKGKAIEIVTLKSLLLPEALAKLEPNSGYRVCTNKDCSIVYFNKAGRTFLTSDLKVLVYPKNDEEDCPVCYCFGWTKKKLKTEIEQTGQSTAVSSISEHIKAGRCGCDVNNPQGSCCLGNVKNVLESLANT